MAKIKFSEKKKSGEKVHSRPSRTIAPAKDTNIFIPEMASEPCDDFNRYSMLVHGEKKIGKTTLFAQEPGTFFMEYDPLQLALAIKQQHVNNWDETLGYIDLLEQGPKDVKNVVVDDAAMMYNQCFDWCCRKLCIVHPTEEKDYGQSWGFIKTEFHSAIHRLLNLQGSVGITPRFICHSKWKEFKDRETGQKLERLVPTLTGQAEEILVGEIDIWAAYTYWGKERILVLKGDEEIGAGHRVDNHFRTAFDGQSVAEVWMGNSPAEAYKNLLTAFNNLQGYVDMHEWQAIQERRQVKKIKPALKIKIGRD